MRRVVVDVGDQLVGPLAARLPGPVQLDLVLDGADERVDGAVGPGRARPGERDGGGDHHLGLPVGDGPGQRGDCPVGIAQAQRERQGRPRRGRVLDGPPSPQHVDGAAGLGDRVGRRVTDVAVVRVEQRHELVDPVLDGRADRLVGLAVRVVRVGQLAHEPDEEGLAPDGVRASSTRNGTAATVAG
ncbi:hypothetical protein ACFQX7_37805 [Luedemannella flava]